MSVCPSVCQVSSFVSFISINFTLTLSKSNYKLISTFIVFILLIIQYPNRKITSSLLDLTKRILSM